MWKFYCFAHLENSVTYYIFMQHAFIVEISFQHHGWFRIWKILSWPFVYYSKVIWKNYDSISCGWIIHKIHDWDEWQYLWHSRVLLWTFFSLGWSLELTLLMSHCEAFSRACKIEIQVIFNDLFSSNIEVHIN